MATENKENYLFPYNIKFPLRVSLIVLLLGDGTLILGSIIWTLNYYGEKEECDLKILTFHTQVKYFRLRMIYYSNLEYFSYLEKNLFLCAVRNLNIVLENYYKH